MNLITKFLLFVGVMYTLWVLKSLSDHETTKNSRQRRIPFVAAVVHLPRRMDRYKTFQQEWDKLNNYVSYKWFIAYNKHQIAPWANRPYPPAVHAIYVSYVDALDSLKQSVATQSYPIVLEDDVSCLPHTFESLERTLQSLPSDWDMYYLGGKLMSMPIFQASSLNVSKWIKLTSVLNTHSIVFNPTRINVLLKMFRDLEYKQVPIDILISNLIKGGTIKAYAPVIPNCAQLKTFSDNHESFAGYHRTLKINPFWLLMHNGSWTDLKV